MFASNYFSSTQLSNRYISAGTPSIPSPWRAAFYRPIRLSIPLSFYFHEVLEQLKNEICTDFHFEKALRFVIQYA